MTGENQAVKPSEAGATMWWHRLCKNSPTQSWQKQKTMCWGLRGSPFSFSPILALEPVVGRIMVPVILALSSCTWQERLCWRPLKTCSSRAMEGGWEHIIGISTFCSGLMGFKTFQSVGHSWNKLLDDSSDDEHLPMCLLSVSDLPSTYRWPHVIDTGEVFLVTHNS